MKKTILFNLLVQTCPHAAFLSIEMLRMCLACAAQSTITNMHQCFCNSVMVGVTSLKCENKQLKLLMKRRKLNLQCAR